jgi:hypothetical protein
MTNRGSTLGAIVKKIIARLFLVAAVAYLAFGAFIWWAMHQSPQTFGRAMSRVPGPMVFLFYPFETLWTRARAGDLKVGDPAPNFSLLKLDSNEHVELSALNKQRPVVLIFGSYT